MQKIIVRRARSQDRKAVVSFCSRIWEGHDYISRVWDQWLGDPFGAFLVAEMNGRPVGTDKISVLAPGEVWLEGLRVDPLRQGEGIAQALNRKAMEIVSDLHPTTVRFGTESGNQASRHMGEATGFRLIFQCQRMLAEACQGDLSGVLWGEERNVDEIMAFLEKSKSMRQQKGLFAWGWTFKILDRSFVERVVAEGGALLARRGWGISALALFLRQRHGPKATLGFIDGAEQEVVALARQFQVVAERGGFEKLLTMVPQDMVPLLSSAGFRQEEPTSVVVYELSGERLKEVLRAVGGGTSYRSW